MKPHRIPFAPALIIWIATAVAVFGLRANLHELSGTSHLKPLTADPVANYLPLAVVALLLGLMPLFKDASKYPTAYRLLNLTATLLGVVFLYRWWLQFVLDITAI